MTQKIVINACHGGFGLSETAELKYLELAGKTLAEFRWEIARDDPVLVQVVELLGKQAGAPHAELKVVAIPDGVTWTIDEYDGLEWIAEVHRKWN